MKAVVQHGYGGVEVLEPGDVHLPAVGEQDVLIRVRATGLNAADWHMMRGEPRIVRPALGLGTPREPVLGSDVAGRVEAVGSAVTRVQVGDDVISEVDRGGLAELVAVPEKYVVVMPARLTYAQAAALPMAGLTALQAVRDSGRVVAGQRVLVNGASSGVGTYAVQIAVALGAEVTGVCGTRNVEMVRGLGARHVLDYRADDFAATPAAYDVIVDIVGNRSGADCRRALTRTGRYVLVGVHESGRWIGMGRQALMLASAPFVRPAMVPMVARRRAEDLDTLAAMVDAGQVTPVIDREYPFADAIDAVAYVDAGHVSGKVVVTH